MKRLNRFKDPRMVSARVERSDVEKFENILAQQPYFHLQDFICYTFRQFISGAIRVEDGKFVMQ